MSWAGTLVDFKDGVSFTGGGNGDTVPSFYLLGGRYALTTHSSGTASATLQALQPDGSYIAAGAAVTATGLFDLAPGTYNILLGAAAATSSGALVRVPLGRSA